MKKSVLDLHQMKARGEKFAAVARMYRLHSNSDLNLLCMSPLVLDR